MTAGKAALTSCPASLPTCKPRAALSKCLGCKVTQLYLSTKFQGESYTLKVHVYTCPWDIDPSETSNVGPDHSNPCILLGVTQSRTSFDGDCQELPLGPQRVPGNISA